MTTTPAANINPAPTQPPAPETLGLAGLVTTLSALLLSVVSFAAAGIAVPDIGASLRASPAEQSLVVSAYSLGFAVPMVLGGRLGNLYGRRRMFLLGMAGFTIFSLAATLSPGITNLAIRTGELHGERSIDTLQLLVGQVTSPGNQGRLF